MTLKSIVRVGPAPGSGLEPGTESGGFTIGAPMDEGRPPEEEAGPYARGGGSWIGFGFGLMEMAALEAFVVIGAPGGPREMGDSGLPTLPREPAGDAECAGETLAAVGNLGAVKGSTRCARCCWDADAPASPAALECPSAAEGDGVPGGPRCSKAACTCP